MKKILSLAASIIIASGFAYADDPSPIIPPDPDPGGTGGGKGGPNNFVPDGQPHVWFDSAAACFIVNVSSLETTTLTVENASGSVVAQFPVTADGTSRPYPVAPLPTGIYLVTLENVEESHSGMLLIP